jgi:lactoylglutathione lyase
MDVLHTALWVGDLDATTSFYVDVLGLAVSREFVGDDGVRNYFLAGESETELQFKPLADHPEGRSAVDPAGIDHVAVAVDSVDDVVEEIGADRVTGGPTTMEDAGVRIAFVTDPDGYGVELIEQR